MLRVATACFAVIVLIASLAGCGPDSKGSDPPKPDGQCAPGVVRAGPDGECVGVTDGAYLFADELGLKDVLGKIKQENDRVVKEASLLVGRRSCPAAA